MYKNKTISIIVPAYNEEEVIEKVVEDLKRLGEEIEIIVVDDGSIDKTYENALKADVKVIKHPYNKGYGAALKTGIKNSKGDTICFFDADNQHRIEDLKEILKYIEDYDAVIGMRTSESHIPFLRKPGKKILSMVANYLSNHKIPDLNCGLRVFKKEVLTRCLHILPDGFSFSTTTTLAMYKMGYNVKWVPVTTRKRMGKSTVKQIKHGMGTLLLIIRVIALFNPLRVFLPTSIILFLLGIGWGIHDIIFNPASIAEVTIFLFLSAILIFFFGILADQIAALRREGRM